MLTKHLFESPWSPRRLLRRTPWVVAIFSFRYDAHLVPDLIENIRPIVHGYAAFDDRQASEPVTIETQRKRLLIQAAREMRAAWVLHVDPDERLEQPAAAQIPEMTATVAPILWSFRLREMYSSTHYRIDGVWGKKKISCLFPLLEGQIFSEAPFHAPCCPVNPGYDKRKSGLNLYHLKMISRDRRLARRDLYKALDPENTRQSIGYDYLADDAGAVLKKIPRRHQYLPPYREFGGLWMADPGSIS
jgi:hypothetical protein